MDILILFLLILLNGFFALSEVALISCKKQRIQLLKNKGKKGAEYALKLIDQSESFLSAIQVGITLIGIITGVYGGISLADDLVPFIHEIQFLAAYSQEIAMILVVIVITYFSIVLGELVPKTIGLSNPEKFAVRVAPIIFYFSKLFYPFVKLLSYSTFAINKLLGIKKASEALSETELRYMIETATMEGIIEPDQQQLHEKIFTFSDKRAKHIMTHRTEVLWVDLEKSEEEIFTIIRESKHERIVCATGDLDHFVGVLQTRNYLLAKLESGQIDISSFIVPLYVIPENTPAQNILSNLRERHLNFCVVVDEYGSFEGIITLHDILEHLVGEIFEEDEIEEPDVVVRQDNSLLVNGDAPIEVLQDYIPNFKIDFEAVDYATVAGFVLDNLKAMPKIGDTFQFEQHTIEIVDMDGNRIDKLLIYPEKKI